MHPINRLLSLIGLKLSRASEFIPMNSKENDPALWPKAFREQYEWGYRQLLNNERGFNIYREYRIDIGDHPRSLQEFEFEFAANHISREKPSNILDIGGFRGFIVGLLAHYKVTSIDFRKRIPVLDNESVITCDAKALTLPNDSFDTVVTIGTLPHVGMGRYGDPIDFDADIKMFKEMVRVLKPGGILIFTTAITGGHPSIAWNARRNYSYDMIRSFCEGLDLVEEKFIDHQAGRECSREELCTKPPLFDYYLGCCRKK